MVQVAVLLCAIGAGFLAKTWRQVAAVMFVVFVVVLIPQTLSVASRADEDVTVAYWVIQILSLAFGLGIARLLVGRRHRRQVVA